MNSAELAGKSQLNFLPSPPRRRVTGHGGPSMVKLEGPDTNSYVNASAEAEDPDPDVLIINRSSRMETKLETPRLTVPPASAVRAPVAPVKPAAAPPPLAIAKKESGRKMYTLSLVVVFTVICAFIGNELIPKETRKMNVNPTTTLLSRPDFFPAFTSLMEIHNKEVGDKAKTTQKLGYSECSSKKDDNIRKCTRQRDSFVTDAKKERDRVITGCRQMRIDDYLVLKMLHVAYEHFNATVNAFRHEDSECDKTDNMYFSCIQLVDHSVKVVEGESITNTTEEIRVAFATNVPTPVMRKILVDVEKQIMRLIPDEIKEAERKAKEQEESEMARSFFKIGDRLITLAMVTLISGPIVTAMFLYIFKG